MTACYDHSHQPAPERPGRLTGPELGLALYVNPRYEKWDGMVVRVIERSYVWSPEQHNPDGTHGYRHYDWSVIEMQPGKTMVVNDTDLRPIKQGEKIAASYSASL